MVGSGCVSWDNTYDPHTGALTDQLVTRSTTSAKLLSEGLPTEGKAAVQPGDVSARTPIGGRCRNLNVSVSKGRTARNALTTIRGAGLYRARPRPDAEPWDHAVRSAGQAIAVGVLDCARPWQRRCQLGRLAGGEIVQHGAQFVWDR